MFTACQVDHRRLSLGGQLSFQNSIQPGVSAWNARLTISVTTATPIIDVGAKLPTNFNQLQQQSSQRLGRQPQCLYLVR